MEQSSALQQQMNENLRIAEEYRIRENELLKEKMEIVGKTFASAKAQIETDKTILKGLSAQARIMANTKSAPTKFLNALFGGAKRRREQRAANEDFGNQMDAWEDTKQRVKKQLLKWKD